MISTLARPSPNPALPSFAAAAPQTSPEQRGEVHRKLGRCLLRLQQYEMLTKAILVDHVQSGTAANWEARRQERIDKFAKKTLGQLVDWMKDSYLRTGSEEWESAESEPPEQLDQIWFSFHGGMQLDAESHVRTVAAMEELVALRNGIVHHLLDKFNLWTLTGCAAADAHLEKSYELIDRHMAELGDWARKLDEASRVTASFLASGQFLDVVLAKPTEAVPPALDRAASIVKRLCEAEAFLAVEGWVLLDDAIAFIGRIDKDEVPTLYGCKTWRQVLGKSGAFEFQRQALPDRSRLYTVYRSLPQRSAEHGRT